VTGLECSLSFVTCLVASLGPAWPVLQRLGRDLPRDKHPSSADLGIVLQQFPNSCCSQSIYEKSNALMGFISPLIHLLAKMNFAFRWLISTCLDEKGKEDIDCNRPHQSLN